MPKIEKLERVENESSVLAAVREACNRLDGVRLFRNNVGKLEDTRGRWVEFGLAEGSADLVGSIKVCIRSPTELGTLRYMVFARSFALEIKDPKRRYDHPEKLTLQRVWHNQVRALGWYTGSNVASVTEALEHVERAGRCEMQGPVDDWDARMGRCPFCRKVPRGGRSPVYVAHDCTAAPAARKGHA